MTINRQVLLNGMTKIIKSLDRKMFDGIIFHGEYMTAFNTTKYEHIKLPEYIPDSFILPTNIFPIIASLRGEDVTIVRTEKHMEISSGNKTYIYSFTRNPDTDDIEDFTGND